MGIAAPPYTQTTTYVSQPTKTISAGRRQTATANSMSHSQDFHHQQQGSGGVFGFSSDGFDRPDSSQDQQQHVAQQSRREKMRVQQGFDSAAAAGHGLLPIQQGGEHAEPAGAMYDDEHAAAAGASNMLSEMFNFAAPPSGLSATELLASQMTAAAAANYRFGLRPAGAGGVAGLSGDDGSCWLGASAAAGRAGLVLGGANNMDSLGETSSPKQQGSMAGIATDPAAAAMQLFLMNPQQQQQQRSRSSPPPSDAQSGIQHHHEAFQAFGSAAAQFGGGGTGVVEGQGLSLSLSPSLQQQAEELRVRDGVLYFNRQQHQQQQGASSSSVHPQLPSMALHGQAVGALGQQLHVGGYGPAGVLRNSKYTRAAQELLEEFCSVGRAGQAVKGGGRGASSSNPNNASSKGGGGGASSSGAAQSPSSASNKEPPQLSPADRFEHQRKKAKLIAMLDEVDRRYNQYCDQMQMVVNLFESVTGFGAATPYTALAQKAMSRHFRCLKDAVAAQLRRACELLGEKQDAAGTTAGASGGITRGETPRLRAIDQSLRQHQRAFGHHHMGGGMMMMVEQDQAWRPQRGLPERSVNILRAWLFEHFLHPYPSDADKHLLSRQTGLSRNQVSNWFINARVRLWKPMIEEMYQQECRELDGSSGGGGGHESGNDPSGAVDRTTTTGAAQQQSGIHHGGGGGRHMQEHGTTTPGMMMPHKTEPGGAAGPSAADAAQFVVGIDPVELLGGGGVADDDLYGRFEPGVRMRYGPGATAGDVSLTLGLQHAGAAGNAGPDGAGRFSLRDYSGC